MIMTRRLHQSAHRRHLIGVRRIGLVRHITRIFGVGKARRAREGPTVPGINSRFRFHRVFPPGRKSMRRMLAKMSGCRVPPLFARGAGWDWVYKTWICSFPRLRSHLPYGSGRGTPASAVSNARTSLSPEGAVVAG
jgi:hypothetical protein